MSFTINPREFMDRAKPMTIIFVIALALVFFGLIITFFKILFYMGLFIISIFIAYVIYLRIFEKKNL